MACQHPDYQFRVEANNFLDSGAHNAEITGRCTVCGKPVRWVGLSAVGVSFTQPTTSPDGVELRIPFVVGNEKLPAGLPGFLVSNIAEPS